MSTTIAGHALTPGQLRALHELTDYLRRYSGDTSPDRNHSPAGDGRWVPLLEVWGRGNKATACRRAIAALHAKGVLAPCEVAFRGGCVKLVAAEQVAQAEAE